MNRQKHASILRTTRKIHRFLGIFLFSFFILIAVTALFLGWKKNSGGMILPDTIRSPHLLAEGRSMDKGSLIGIDSVQILAMNALAGAKPGLSTKIDRLDVRPGQGVAKVTFKQHYWEVQVDLLQGDILQIAERNSDFIENLHDGSYFDKFFGTGSDVIKIFYTSIMGLALLSFSVTGFWLWYGPKRMRRNAAQTLPEN